MAKLKANHRLAFHNFMKINTILRTKDNNKDCSAHVPDVTHLFTVLKTEIGYSKGYDHKRITLTLADVEFSDDGEYCCVMINVKDKTAGTSVIVEDATNIHQEIPLPLGKSWGVSMHVLFKITPTSKMYHVIYEQVPDIGHSRLISFVNHMFFSLVRNNETEFTREVRNKEVDPKTNKIKKEKFRLTFTIDPMPYDGFTESVDGGKISDIQLVKEVDNGANYAVDSHKEIIERAHILKLQTPKITTGKYDYLKAVGEKYASGYDRLKFNFTDSQDVSGTIEMNTQDFSLENLVKAFSKKSKLSGFATDLKDSYQSIHKPIMTKLIEVTR